MPDFRQAERPPYNNKNRGGANSSGRKTAAGGAGAVPSEFLTPAAPSFHLPAPISHLPASGLRLPASKLADPAESHRKNILLTPIELTPIEHP